MRGLKFNNRESIAMRELLARIDSGTIRNVLSLKLQKDLLDDGTIEDYTKKIMALKHASFQNVDEGTYTALRSFLMRLDVGTVQQVLSQELFGCLLTDSKNKNCSMLFLRFMRITICQSSDSKENLQETSQHNWH